MADIIARALALSAVRVAPTHNFASATARDQYFEENPSQLKPNLYVYCDGQLQIYNGTEWKDATPAISGPEGYSPSITVNTETEEEYKLKITNKDGEFITPNLKGTGGGSTTYTNLNPTTIAVGGIPVGTTFDNIPIQDVFNMMLYGAQNPTLEDPFAEFDMDLDYLQEVGSTINPTFTATFDRGSIDPQYRATEPYRAGLPRQYVFTGPKVNFITSSELEVSQTIEYIVPAGETSWAMFVEYGKGPQPYNSVGMPYSTPLPGGVTTTHTIKVKGVYPLYAPTSDISIYEKLPLQDTTSTEYTHTFPAESAGNKQRILIPKTLQSLYGIKFYNTILQQWEWLMGSPENSVTTFSKTSTTIGGVEYWEYVNLSAQIGARELKFILNGGSTRKTAPKNQPLSEAEIEAERIKQEILKNEVEKWEE